MRICSYSSMVKIEVLRSQRYILGALLAAFSTYSLLNNEFAMGITWLVIAVVVFTTSHYTAFNFVAGCQGRFTCLLGIFHLGDWEKMPAVNHIVLKRFSEIITEEISDSGVNQTVRNQYYIILLSVCNSSEGIIALREADLQKARRIAVQLSDAANLELKDYSGR